MSQLDWNHFRTNATEAIFRCGIVDQLIFVAKRLNIFTGCISIILGIAAGNVQAQSQPQTQSNDTQAEQTAIEAILTEQTKAWNEGNLEKFMQTYWKSDKLTFSSGGKTTYGWQATLENYKKNYAPPKQMGHLHFDRLEVSPIESNSYLVLGNWHLTMKDDKKLDGNFSLVVKKFGTEWKIIHDHSSSLEPAEAANRNGAISRCLRSVVQQMTRSNHSNFHISGD